DPSKYSLFAVASHEIDEVLGFASALNGLNNGDLTPTGAIAPEDLFRYDQNGARSLTTALNAVAYFSLDGVTHIARFSQQQGGDFSDWYSPGQPPQVQDAFSTAGAAPVLGVELRALDVIGYTRVEHPTLTLSHVGSNVILTWPANAADFNLESKTNLAPTLLWTPVTPLPSLVNGQNTV